MGRTNRSRLRELMSEVARDLLQEMDLVSVDDVVAEARERAEDLFADEADRLIADSVRKMAKGVMTGLSKDSGQLVLPGFQLPTCLDIPTESGWRWIATAKATWKHLEMGEVVRTDNVRRAQVRLDQYHAALRRLRPIMQPNPEMTVTEAVEQIEDEDDDDS